MAIIVEDGSGVPNANSYASIADIRTYAEARGVSLSSDDAVVSPMVIKAMDYIESFRDQYQGEKTYPTQDHPARQALQWPRVGVVIDGISIAQDEIPAELIGALSQAVIEIATSPAGDLMPNQTGQVVKRQKVDVIEREFFTYDELGGQTPGAVGWPKIDALLEPLFGSNGYFLRGVRI